MKKRNRKETEPQMVLKWLFRQRDRLLACGVRRGEGRDFEVVTVPLWDVGRSTVERFPSAVNALRRHAEIASTLRASGWSGAAYTR